MLRAFVVLPVYLACLYFAPRWPAYERFHDTVAAHGVTYIEQHVLGYTIGIVVAAILALLMSFVWKPRTYAQSVLSAVFRMGLIGAVFTCAYQLYSFYTGGELSVFMIVMPFVFMAAELIYEFVEYIVGSLSRLAGVKIQSA